MIPIKQERQLSHVEPGGSGAGPACPDQEKGEKALKTGFFLFQICVQVGRFPRNTISMSQQPRTALQVTLSPARRPPGLRQSPSSVSPALFADVIPQELGPKDGQLCFLCMIINTVMKYRKRAYKNIQESQPQQWPSQAQQFSHDPENPSGELGPQRQVQAMLKQTCKP